MPRRVEIPHLGVTAEFPDGTPDDVIRKAIHREYYTDNFATNAYEGALSGGVQVGKAVGSVLKRIGSGVQNTVSTLTDMTNEAHQLQGEKALRSEDNLLHKAGGAVKEFGKDINTSIDLYVQPAVENMRDPDLRTGIIDSVKQGGLWEELKRTPRRLSRGVGEMAPGMAASIGAGAVGTVLGGPVGGFAAASIVGGSLEGAGTYEEVLAETGSEEEANKAFDQMLVASSILNAPYFAGVFRAVPREAKGRMWKLVRNSGALGSIEALTEFTEEIVGQNIVQGPSLDATLAGAKQGVDVLGPAFVTGLGGAVGSNNVDGQQLDADNTAAVQSEAVVNEARAITAEEKHLTDIRKQKADEMLKKKAGTPTPVPEKNAESEVTALPQEQFDPEVEEFFAPSPYSAEVDNFFNPTVIQRVRPIPQLSEIDAFFDTSVHDFFPEPTTEQTVQETEQETEQVATTEADRFFKPIRSEDLQAANEFFAGLMTEPTTEPTKKKRGPYRTKKRIAADAQAVQEFFGALEEENARRAELTERAKVNPTDVLEQPAFSAETTVDIEQNADRGEVSANIYPHIPFTLEEVGAFNSALSNVSEEGKPYLLAMASMLINSQASNAGVAPRVWKEAHLAGVEAGTAEQAKAAAKLAEALQQKRSPEELGIRETRRAVVIEQPAVQKKAHVKSYSKQYTRVITAIESVIKRQQKLLQNVPVSDDVRQNLQDALDAAADKDADSILRSLERVVLELGDTAGSTPSQIARVLSGWSEKLVKLNVSSPFANLSRASDFDTRLAESTFPQDETATVDEGTLVNLRSAEQVAATALSRLIRGNKNDIQVSDKDAGVINALGDMLRTAGVPVELTDKGGEGVTTFFLNEANKAMLRQTVLNDEGVVDEEGNKIPRGHIVRLEDGRFLIRTFSTHDASTAVHEFVHLFAKTAVPELRQDIHMATVDWFKKILKGEKEPAKSKSGKDTMHAWKSKNSVAEWKTLEHERFAEAAEAYFLTGEAPTKELEYIYSGLREQMATVYDDVKKAFPEFISPQVTKVFDTILQPVYAKRGFGQLMRAVQALDDERLEQSGTRDRRRRVEGRLNSVNFDYTELPLAVHKQLADAVEALGAKPGTSHEQVLEAATKVDINSTVAKALQREGLTPHEAVAIRLGSTIFMSKISKTFFGQPLTPETVQAFTNMNEGIARIMQDSANNAGRLLNSYQIHISPDIIAKFMRTAGEELNQNQMQALLEAVAEGSLEKMKAAHDGLKSKKLKTLYIGFIYNNMLSGIPTAVVNITGNFVMQNYMALHRMNTGMLDMMISVATGRQREVFATEAFYNFVAINLGPAHGLMKKNSPYRKAWKSAFQTLTTGRSDWHTKWDDEVGQYTIDHYEEALREALSHIGIKGRPARVTAGAFNIVTRSLMAADIFFKAIYSVGERNAIDHAMARIQKKYGAEGLTKFALRMFDIEREALAKMKLESRMRNLPESVNEDIASGDPARIQRANAMITKTVIDSRVDRMAEHATFQDKPGDLTDGLMKLREKFPVLGRTLLPWMQTPSNLMKRSLELVPILGIPASRMSKLSWAETMAKQAEGTLLVLALWSKFVQGGLVGRLSDDEEERQRQMAMGMLPYSIEVLPGQWVSYQRIEPFGLPIMILADLLQQAKEIEEDGTSLTVKQKSMWDIVSRAVSTVVTRIIDSSYVSNLSDLLSEEQGVEQWAPRQASALIPFSSFWRTIHATMEADSTGMIASRQRTFLDTFARGLPFPVEKLMSDPRLNGLGEVQGRKSSFLQEWLPFRMNSATTDKVEQELVNIQRYPLPPGQIIALRPGVQVRIPDDVYYEYVIDTGFRMKDMLSQVIERPSYQTLPNDRKVELVNRIAERARDIERRRVVAQLRQTGLGK